MKRPLFLLCLCTLLSVTVTAQGFGVAPRGMPMLPPVAGSTGQQMPASGSAPSMPGGCGASQTPSDPVTTGPQLAGKELARAIATVTALRWHDDLAEARLESAATGKPILWLQSLGDIDGFA